MNEDVALNAIIIFSSVILGGLITLIVNFRLHAKEREAQYAIQARQEIYDSLYDEIKQVHKALDEFRDPFIAKSTLKVWDELKPSIKLRVPRSLKQLIEKFDVKARKFYELDNEVSQVLLNSVVEATNKWVPYDQAYEAPEDIATNILENYRGDFLAGHLLEIRHGRDLKSLLRTEEEPTVSSFFTDVCSSIEKDPKIIELRKIQKELIEGEIKDLEKYLEEKINHILKKYESKLIKI